MRRMPNGTRRTFDSQREAGRYDELVLLLRAGEIKDLRLQQTYTLQEGFVTAQGDAVRPVTYKADFTYLRRREEGGEERWERVVEDVKGMRTKEYALKRRLMLGQLGIEIKEV